MEKAAEVARLFLRLGFTAFGGPAAHLAVMKDEVVDRRQWLSEAEFLDLLGAAQLIPGPSSTEMAIFIGFHRAGWPGLALAGLCFILPAVAIVLAFAWAYVTYGQLPQAGGLLYGVKPVIVAVIAQAVAGLVKPSLKSRLLTVVAVGSLALALLGAPPLPILIGAGATSALYAWGRLPDRRPAQMLTLVAVLLAALAIPASIPTTTGEQPLSQTTLFLFFLKVGSVLYGSGYLLLAFLQDGLVSHLQWLTLGQLLDATAVGQFTPGPVFTTATFIGYLLGGLPGALTATVGIFLPSFVFVAMSGPVLPRLRGSQIFRHFLDGVNVAALALMMQVAVQLGRTAMTDLPAAGLAVGSAVLLVRLKVSSSWLILAGAALGLAWRG